MMKKVLEIDEIFNLALKNHQENNLKNAENLYKEILDKNSNHLDSIFLLGSLYAQKKDFILAKKYLFQAENIQPKNAGVQNNLGNVFRETKETRQAIKCYEKAISIQTDYVDAYNNLGGAYEELRNFQEAIKCYKRAITIKPDYAGAHNNLGTVFKELRNFQEAIKCYKRAITIKPDYAGALNNLGTVLKELGDFKEAAKHYKKALEIQPENASIYNNLGGAFKELEEFENAIECYQKALLINPDHTKAINNLTLLIRETQFNNIDRSYKGNLKELYIFLFKRNDIDHSDIFYGARLFLFKPHDYEQLKLTIKSDSLLLKNKIIKNLLKDELFLLMLQKSIVADKFLEQILTKLRYEILFSSFNSDFNLIENNSEFIISLAEQCFLNEYIFFESKKETNDISQLKESLENDETLNELKIALLGCYVPLYRYKNIIPRLINYKSRNILFNDLINMQIKEPTQESKLAISIANMGKISDEVSMKVRSQYEEYPYPRWRYTYANSASNFLTVLNNQISPNKIMVSNKFDNPDVLIAGCGTGSHIFFSQDYLNANILAVDLSLSSLAYAKRKVIEKGLKNVKFLQADILNLNTLNRKFDVIECLGVLHHMRDPLDGLSILLNLLKPHGLLRLGLYSSTARKHVVEARKFIKENKFKDTVEDIRNCRVAINNHKDNKLLCKVSNGKDFYSTSTLRDLIFHVQEHHFTLPQLSNILKKFNLEFLGFTNILMKKQIFKLINKEKIHESFMDLNKYELDNPDTFIYMYNFWVRKLTED